MSTAKSVSLAGVGVPTGAWRWAAMGAALYSLAYAARCEHALQALDPTLERRRARDTLGAERDRFLAAVRV